MRFIFNGLDALAAYVGMIDEIKRSARRDSLKKCKAGSSSYGLCWSNSDNLKLDNKNFLTVFTISSSTTNDMVNVLRTVDLRCPPPPEVSPENSYRTADAGSCYSVGTRLFVLSSCFLAALSSGVVEEVDEFKSRFVQVFTSVCLFECLSL
jgi:hypothetical protein